MSSVQCNLGQLSRRCGFGLQGYTNQELYPRLFVIPHYYPDISYHAQVALLGSQ